MRSSHAESAQGHPVLEDLEISDFSPIPFLRDVRKQFSVGTMLEKESVHAHFRGTVSTPGRTMQIGGRGSGAGIGPRASSS
jgi:hypothetical protein